MTHKICTILLLCLALLFSLASHPIGCSPFIALSVCVAARSTGKGRALLPILYILPSLLQSDVYVGWWIPAVSLAVTMLCSRQNSVLGLGIASSFVYFVVSNTCAWFTQMLPYTMDFQGWVVAISMGIPFLVPHLLWNTAFVGVIFMLNKSLSHSPQLAFR